MDPHPRESLNSGEVGQMTALMRAASTGPRVLRIAVVRGTRIVDERILRPRATVTMGFSESNTFVVADPNAPVACRLFEFSDGAYFLNTTGGMRGRVATATSALDLGYLAPIRIPLDDSSRGKIVIGDVAFLFQFVIAPPPEARSQLPISIVRTEEIDWKTTVIAAFSFMMHFVAIGAVYSDWFDLPMDYDIVVANVLDSVQPFAPALDPETAVESTQATPENASAAKEPSRPRKDPGSAVDSGQKVAALGNAIDRLQMSALGVLSTSGATTDVLRSGEVPTGLLDETARRDTGVGSPGLALSGGAALKPGAQGPGLATIGDIHGGGGEGTGTTSKQKGPRGTVNASPPDVRGAPIQNAAGVIAGLRAGFRRCYERAIAINPDTEGRIALSLRVGPNGEVQSVGAVPTGNLSSILVGCIRAHAQAAQFDPPHGGLGAVVQVPVSLVRQQ